MKYDSYDDFKFFILGASITSGRVFWVGEEGNTNKSVSCSLSNDGKVASIKAGGDR